MSIQRRLSGQKLIECRKYFSANDLDNDGQLSWKEFSNMCHTTGLRLNEREMNKVFSMADSNKNGYITFIELCQTFFVNEDCINKFKDIEPLSSMSKSRVAAIKEFFYDKTQHHYGKISQLTFVCMIKRYGIQLSNYELNKVLELADDDKDGMISYKEFINHFIKNPLQSNDNIIRMEILKLRDAFSRLDNGDGMLSRNKFLSFCKTVEQEIDKELLKTIYQNALKDEKGLVKFDEYCEIYLETRQGVVGKRRKTHKTSVANVPVGTLANLRKHFNACDNDRNGRLDWTEFKQIIETLDLPERTTNEALLTLIPKSQSSISFAEFVKIYYKVEEMTQNMIVKKEITDCCKHFWLADKDCDGKLDVEEFGGMLFSLGMNPTKQDVETEFARHNLNGDGFISFKEFVITYLNREKTILTVEKIKEIFCRVDQNGNGTLSRSEFFEALNNLGNTTEDENVKTGLLNNIDDNNNGKITFNEYSAFLGLDE